jgi:hypothetical protein
MSIRQVEKRPIRLKKCHKKGGDTKRQTEIKLKRQTETMSNK